MATSNRIRALNRLPFDFQDGLKVAGVDVTALNQIATANGAGLVGVTPVGGVLSTNVQAALAELDTKKIAFTRLDDTDGSSLVGYDGGTVQDVLDAVTGTNGAANVGYTPAGAGSVDTTVQSKLRETVSVFDFMTEAQIADAQNGTETLDLTSAVQTTISQSPAGSEIRVPKGVYRLSKSAGQNYCILVDKKVKLVFDAGAIFKANSDVRYIIKVSESVVDIFGAGAQINGNYKANYGIAFFGVSKGSVRGITCQDFYASTEVLLTSNGSAAGIYGENSSGLDIDTCTVKNVKGLGTPSAIGATGDSHGVSSGIVLTGTAAVYGINTVKNCTVDNVYNEATTVAYHDDDGINSQTANTHTVIKNNILTRCGKRGVKLMTPGDVCGNVIITSKGVNSSDSFRMYSGISVYSSNANIYGNVIQSGPSGGSCEYGIEIGGTLINTYNNVKVHKNNILFSEASYGQFVYGIAVFGSVDVLSIRKNTITMPTATANPGNGIVHFAPLNVANMLLVSTDVSHNTIKNAEGSVRISHAVFGSVCNNAIVGERGTIAILVEVPSGSTVFSEKISFAFNDIKIVYSGASFTYGIRAISTKIKNCIVVGNKFITSAPAGGQCNGVHGLHYESFDTDRAKLMYVTTPPNNTLTTDPDLAFSRGDKIINIDPRDAYPIVSWVCRYANTSSAAPVWIPAEFIMVIGPTSSRPSLTTNERGVQYFDTTLAANGKPIWWTGLNWVDHTGTVV